MKLYGYIMTIALMLLVSNSNNATEPTLYEVQLINHVKKSIAKAEQRNSKLSAEVLAVDGMTSHKVKHLLNNICTLPNSLYLEIGTHKGATFTAALYGNHDTILRGVAMDIAHFNECTQNCATFLANVAYEYCIADCFTIDPTKLFKSPINIYFYDGYHNEDCQEAAFTYYDSIFDSSFIAMVDDWNYPDVRSGTAKAFKKLGYTTLFERELPAYSHGDKTEWWNGFYIAVVRRNNQQ